LVHAILREPALRALGGCKLQFGEQPVVKDRWRKRSSWA
jgi:hypothetical protein